MALHLRAPQRHAPTSLSKKSSSTFWRQVSAHCTLGGHGRVHQPGSMQLALTEYLLCAGPDRTHSTVPQSDGNRPRAVHPGLYDQAFDPESLSCPPNRTRQRRLSPGLGWGTVEEEPPGPQLGKPALPNARDTKQNKTATVAQRKSRPKWMMVSGIMVGTGSGLGRREPSSKPCLRVAPPCLYRKTRSINVPPFPGSCTLPPQTLPEPVPPPPCPKSQKSSASLCPQ